MEGLEGLIDDLMEYFKGLDCFVLKNSIVLLLASISGLNKYKILENLQVLMKELLVEFFAVYKYAHGKNLKKTVQNVLLSNNFKLFENVEGL